MAAFNWPISQRLRREEEESIIKSLDRARDLLSENGSGRPTDLRTLCVRKSSIELCRIVLNVCQSRRQSGSGSCSRMWDWPEVETLRNFVSGFPRIGVVDDVYNELFGKVMRRTRSGSTSCSIKEKTIEPEMAVKNVISGSPVSSLLHTPFTVKHMTPKSAFLLWWIFVDPLFLKEIRLPLQFPQFCNVFSDQLVSLLVDNKYSFKNVHTLCIQYNFILRSDYVKILNYSLPRLRHVFLNQETVSSSVLQVFGQTPNKMSTFHIEITRDEARKLKAEDLQHFLTNQDELVELDLAAFAHLITGDISIPLEPLSRMKKLEKLKIKSQWFKVLSDSKKVCDTVKEIAIDMRDTRDAIGMLIAIDNQPILKMFVNLKVIELFVWFSNPLEHIIEEPVTFLKDFQGQMFVRTWYSDHDTSPNDNQPTSLMESLKFHFSNATEFEFISTERLVFSPEPAISRNFNLVTRLDLTFGLGLQYADFMSLLFFPPCLEQFRIHISSHIPFNTEFLTCCKQRSYRGSSISKHINRITLWWRHPDETWPVMRPIMVFYLMYAATVSARSLDEVKVTMFQGGHEDTLIRDFEGNGQPVSTFGAKLAIMYFDEKLQSWLTSDLRRLF